MKKKQSEVSSFLNESRFRKKIKRCRDNTEEKPQLTKYQIQILSHRHYSEFNRFMRKIFDGSSTSTNKLKVPNIFSFGSKFDEAIKFYNDLNFTLYQLTGKVVIDFSECTRMNMGAATFLQITLLEYFQFSDKLNKSHHGKIENEVSFINSKRKKVNKMLFSLRMISSFEGIDSTENSSFLSLNLIIGAKKRSGFKDNNKGKIGNKINLFINDSIRGFGYEFDEDGQKNMSNLIGEILGNAEDHSKLNNYYVNGVSYMEGKSNPIVELNLAIINLGYSFFEGFIAEKEENKTINALMEKIYNHHKALPNFNSNDYAKESLYTLYGLQEGISRLKYEDESRGNGTMNFIRAFMNLGQLGEENKKYKSELNIISGHTVIDCTNEHKPYMVDGFYQLSLNKERDIRKLPSKNAIFTKKGYFPGTILQVKIFMSKEHFMKVIINDTK